MSTKNLEETDLKFSGGIPRTGRGVYFDPMKSFGSSGNILKSNRTEVKVGGILNPDIDIFTTPDIHAFKFSLWMEEECIFFE